MPHFEIGYQPAHSLAKVTLQANESLIAESGAMVGMSTNVNMETQSKGGLMGGLKRMFGGESFFRNTFTAHNGPGEVLLAQALCGDMVVLEMTQAGYFIQNSAYIASSMDVNIETQTGGFKGFFSGAGVFILHATSQQPGQVLIGAFGGIEELHCDGNMVIDTGHLVAWDGSLSYTIGKSGAGWIASYLSGEGLVCDFQGQGRIWIQSRNPGEYGKTIGAMLPPRTR
ncbi:MAG TPA: TIGR00266 family protein [Polyangiaceae bacterium]|nr:TIGR00266 family protein [Polyangiaceae bacterium]